MPTFVAREGAEVVGFLTLRATSERAIELHVMAVPEQWHRHGIGRAR